MLCLVAVLSALSALSCKAPVPKGAQVPVYFPLQKGAKWVYKSSAGKETRVVTEVKSDERGYTVAVANEGAGKWSAAEAVIVTDNGLFQAAYADEPLDPPICIFKTPAKVGEKWNASASFSLFVLKTRFEVLEPEKVKVPAGLFQAVPVVRVFSLEWPPGNKAPLPPSAAPKTVTEWYAPNVGLVKSVRKEKAGDCVTELESFMPGKPD
ncbi:MAG: hypothetical protein J0I06_17215 [Planctomycetes bacterium]|nr:hypothetical protein [Planctomycetota bacterium]